MRPRVLDGVVWATLFTVVLIAYAEYRRHVAKEERPVHTRVDEQGGAPGDDSSQSGEDAPYDRLGFDLELVENHWRVAERLGLVLDPVQCEYGEWGYSLDDSALVIRYPLTERGYMLALIQYVNTKHVLDSVFGEGRSWYVSDDGVCQMSVFPDSVSGIDDFSGIVKSIRVDRDKSVFGMGNFYEDDGSELFLGLAPDQHLCYGPASEYCGLKVEICRY